MDTATLSRGLQANLIFSHSMANVSSFENILTISDNDLTLREKEILAKKLDSERGQVAASFSSATEALDYLRNKKTQQGK